jgi:hypothetical protein
MNRSRPPARRRTTALPSAHHGLGSVIALAGTGRLDELARVLRHGRRVVDRYGYVAGLEHGVASLRGGQP